MEVFQVDVGFTYQRPVVPDQKIMRVTLEAEHYREAEDVAFAMVCGWPGVEMVTSTQVLV